MNLHMSVQSSVIIMTKQWLKTSVHQLMNVQYKQNAIYPYSETLFSNNKE